MATQAPNQPLPLLYSEIEPLSSNVHGNMKIKAVDKAPVIGNTHAIPATVDEFPLLSRHYPIVFSAGDDPVPLALMGLSEGVNVFLDENGKARDPHIYLPAYIRRYPFLLAKLRPDTDELSLCFDPTLGSIGEFEDGERLFDDNGEPSEATKAILQFCEQFETAGQRTAAFIQDIKQSGLLMDGEVAIQPEGAPQPFVYRGFRMVDEEKFRASLLAVADPRCVRSSGRARQRAARNPGTSARRGVIAKARHPAGRTSRGDGAAD